MLWKWLIISLSIILLSIGVVLIAPVLKEKNLAFRRSSLPLSAIINPETETKLPRKNSDNSQTIVSLPITSVQQIFSETGQKTYPPDAVTILITGDVLTARSVNSKMTQINDFTWPFQKTKQLLESADATFINLETPIIKDCKVKTDGMFFCGSIRNVAGLKYAGVDIITMANNHAGNQGEEGVRETEKILQDAGFLVTGVHGPVYKKIKGSTFAFLGFNDVDRQSIISHADDAAVIAQISEARKKADIIIVEFHWGEEYTYTPTERQKELARIAIDSGADLVVGNHPHWIQPLEFYKGKLIAYSHGNFVFDQMWSKETRQGIVGKYIFQGKNLIAVEYVPILIENYGQPRILEGAEAKSVFSILEIETKRITP